LGGGNLSRDAGLNDIGGSNRLASYDNSSAQPAGLFDTTQGGVEDGDMMDGDDFANDFGGDFGGGDDTA
jgi:hypothetical protein